MARGTVFQEIRPGVGFETGDPVQEMLGGYRRTTPMQVDVNAEFALVVMCVVSLIRKNVPERKS